MWARREVGLAVTCLVVGSAGQLVQYLVSPLGSQETPPADRVARAVAHPTAMQWAAWLDLTIVSFLPALVVVAALARARTTRPGWVAAVLAIGTTLPGVAYLSRQVASAAHAVALAGDLARSRERLVAATEEERRRLRRDLHDGLGPALAGVVLGLQRTRARVISDPAAAQTQLDELTGQVQGAVADVRRLVYGLRPPAVDELGLVGAIEEQAQAMGGFEVHGAVDGDLPAAVEVAAYRIALEAMTNSLRHGGGRWCRMGVEFDGALHVVVEDDGVGLPEQFRAGVGITSMRERAAELGGACSVSRREPAGTTVRAVLPVTVPAR